MANTNQKTGCGTWIAIILVLGVVISVVQECNKAFHRKQAIVLPHYSSFKRTGSDPVIYFQTFDKNDLACLNFFYNSGTSAPLYVVIKNGNELYDGGGSFCGYIIVKSDGSFRIKGWDQANGKYVGVDGARMSLKSSRKRGKETIMDDSDDTDTDSDFGFDPEEEINSDPDPVNGSGSSLTDDSSPEDILSLLYPSASASDNGLSDSDVHRIQTERFESNANECDHNVLFQTRDATYSYVDDPAPTIKKYPNLENAYLVEWTRSKNAPKVRLVLVFVKDIDGLWKIDNAIEHPGDSEESLLFNYNQATEPAYDEDNSLDEIEEEVEVVEEVEEEAIHFQLVQEKPSFNGGDNSVFNSWINEHIQYPEIAKENGVQGRVTLQFTVEKDGSVTNVKVLRGVDSSLDEEAIRVISSSSGMWSPGKQNNQPVRVIYTTPVVFKLQ